MKHKSLIVLVLLLFMVAFTTWISLNIDFTGTDDQATDAIIAIDETYEPWFNSIFEPSDSGEVFLFIFQGVAGAVLTAACLHRYNKKVQDA